MARVSVGCSCVSVGGSLLVLGCLCSEGSVCALLWGLTVYVSSFFGHP